MSNTEKKLNKGVAVRVYRVNREKVDEACQQLTALVLELASDKKLTEIKEQIEERLGQEER